MSSSESAGAGQPSRLYRAFAQVSQAVVRSRTRQELLDEVVRVLVEAGGFAMAFITWYDPESHELKPVARFGDTTGYSRRIRIYGDDRPLGRGPAGIAFRSGVPYLCQDFRTDPATEPWHEQAIVPGWRGSAAIPISMGGKPCGIVSAYALLPWAFGSDEQELFAQIACDVSLGLDRLDTEEKRRQAEEALATSQRRLQLAIDAAAIGTYEWDMMTGQVIWDERSEHLFGYAPGTFDGTFAGFAARIHPEDLTGIERVLATSTRDRMPFVHEFRVVWPDSSIHWVSSRGEFSRDDAGRPLRLYGAAFDISDRKRAEEALQENEERLRQAVRASSIGIFDHDHVRERVYWSPELRAIHGRGETADVAFSDYVDTLHPDDRGQVLETLHRSHGPSSDGRFDVENRLLLEDGSVRWTRTRSQITFCGEGERRRPVRTVGAVTDVTEHRRNLEEQRKLASVVERSTEFIGIATIQGKVTYLNDAALRLVGLANLEEAQQKTIFEFFPDAVRSTAEDDMYPALVDRGYWSGETLLRHFQTGAPIEVEMEAFQILDDRGAPIFLATITREIGERKRAAAENAKLEASLFQSQKLESVGRLAGGVAHDVNNMLMVVLGFADLATEKTSDPGVLSDLHEIMKAAERSRQIAQQLLGFSRQQTIAPKPADLNAIVEDLHNPLACLIGEDIELRFEPAPALWRALLDSSQVNQVIINLAINARDAMPHGGRLTIETANFRATEEYARSQAECKPGDYVVLAISDNGHGMSRETQDHIFEPFFTTKEQGKGTGLGLATVYGIVKQNGGFVNVYSEIGHGSTFRMYFPRLVMAGAEHRQISTQEVMGAGRVLLVEDDDLVRNVTTAALIRIGYTPLVAADAEEALRICNESSEPIHLMLTDVVMPGLTGSQLRDRIVAIRPGIKVLFMSGYTSNVIVTHGVLKEGVHFIQKPFSVQELARKIAEVLGAAGHEPQNPPGF